MIITLEENINMENAFDLKDMLIEKIKMLDSKDKLILDFKKIGYIDSTGLGVLVSIHKRTSEKEIDFNLDSRTNVTRPGMIYSYFQIN